MTRWPWRRGQDMDAVVRARQDLAAANRQLRAAVDADPEVRRAAEQMRSLRLRNHFKALLGQELVERV